MMPSMPAHEESSEPALMGDGSSADALVAPTDAFAPLGSRIALPVSSSWRFFQSMASLRFLIPLASFQRWYLSWNSGSSIKLSTSLPIAIARFFAMARESRFPISSPFLDCDSLMLPSLIFLFSFASMPCFPSFFAPFTLYGQKARES